MTTTTPYALLDDASKAVWDEAFVGRLRAAAAYLSNLAASDSGHVREAFASEPTTRAALQRAMQGADEWADDMWMEYR